MPTEDVVDVLVKLDTLTTEQAQAIRVEANTRNIKPIEVIRAHGIVSDDEILEAVAKTHHTDYVRNIMDQPLDEQAVSLIEETQARRWKVLPLSYDKVTLTVAVEPKQIRNLTLKDDIRRIAKVKAVKFALISPQDMERGIARAYRAENALRELSRDAAEEDAAERRRQNKDPLTADTEINEETKVTQFVSLVLNQAIVDGASDIHIEPGEHSLRIRYRVDGVLKTVRDDVPMSLASEIASRIKIMASMDIAKRTEPQDGRLSMKSSTGRRMDFRVAILPAIYGENIVMRLNDNTLASVELEKLGFSPENYAKFTKATDKPYGMILVTGPTGSGKSTTLYSALNRVISDEVKIWTVEDPVEYRIKGVNQIQVDPPRVTFARALRGILRADPEIVLVGEIRDHETAQIAMEAGLTGHLVLSTLHTNTASGAVARLTEMGIEPFLVGTVVEAVLAQRLVRRLCQKCKEEYTPTRDELIAAEYWPANVPENAPLPTLCRAVGCSECGQSGYRGRTAIHEVLIVDDAVEKLIVEGKTSDDIEDYAISQGMHTLKEDGWLKVTNHETSLQEILRVVV